MKAQDAQEFEKLGGLTITKPIKPTPPRIKRATFDAYGPDRWTISGDEHSQIYTPIPSKQGTLNEGRRLMIFEEMAELQKEICKNARGKSRSSRVVLRKGFSPPADPTPPGFSNARRCLAKTTFLHHRFSQGQRLQPSTSRYSNLLSCQIAATRSLGPR